MSLFSTIMKYLSYPNLMVYVTADEDQLYDVIEGTMNRRMGKSEELEMYGSLISPFIRSAENMKRVQDRIITKMDIIDQTPKFYGDKILPPSSRYYLETFESCLQKKQFVYSVSRESPSVSLSDCFVSQISRYIDHVMESSSEEVKRARNFLMYNDEFIDIYLSFCGETSRQLHNAVFKLSEFVDELIAFHDRYKRTEDPGSHQEFFLKRLHQIIFDYCSNMLGMLAENNEEKWQTRQLLRDIMTHRAGAWGIYINYIYLRDYIFDRYDEPGGSEKLYYQAVSIFILMFFVENILKIESEVKEEIFTTKRDRIHGQGIFIEVLDMFTSSSYSLVWKKQTDEIGQFLWFYGTLIDSPMVLMDFDPLESRKVRAYFRCLPLSKEPEPEHLETYDRENPRWFRTMVFILYASREGLYNLRKSDFLLIRLNENSSDYWDGGVRVELQNMLAGLLNTLSVPPARELLEQKINYLGQASFRDILAETVNEEATESVRTVTDMKILLQKKYQNEYGRTLAAYIGKRYALPVKFDPDSSNSIYLDAMQAAADGIEEKIYSFHTYRIRDLDTVLAYAQNLSIDYAYQMAFDLSAVVRKNEKEDYVAPGSDLKRIMRTAFNELVRTGDDENYYESLEKGVDSSDKTFYRSMLEQIEFYLQTEKDLENAIDLLAYCQYFSFVQDLYFRKFLCRRAELDLESRVDKEVIPYEGIYHEIRKQLISPDGFLGERLQRYVREGVADYIDSL